MFKLEECKGVRKNLFFAIAAQVLGFISSIFTSLVVPKALGVDDYGYWQLFVLYSSYTGIAMLGVNDGLVLRLAGKHLDEVDYRAFRGELALVVFSQTIMLILLAFPLAAMWCNSPERLFVAAAVVANGVISNVTTFISFLFQSVNLTHVQSKVGMASRVVFLVMLLELILYGMLGYKQLIIVSVISQLVFLLFICLYLHGLIAGTQASWGKAAHDAVADMRSGFKVMVAYQADQLIVGVARSLVDARWGVAVFGFFSFSTSIIMFFLSFVSQLSTVFLPMIRRLGDGGAARAVGDIQATLGVILPIGYLFYFPARLLIAWWLPQYLTSIDFLAVLLPVCFFDCKMNLLCGTFFKSLRKETYLLAINLFTMAISSVLVVPSIFILNSAYIAALCIVVCIAARSIVSEILLFSFYKKRIHRQLISEIVLAVSFELAVACLNIPIVFFAVLLLYYVANRDALRTIKQLWGARHV